MDGLTLLIDKPNTSVTMKAGALVIRRLEETPKSVPLGCLEAVIIFGRPQVSCDVWRALANAGVPATLLPGRGNSVPAFLGAGMAAGLAHRHRQHLVFANEPLRLDIARNLCRRKFSACMAALQTDSAFDGVSIQAGKDAKSSFVESLDLAWESVDRVNSISELLGVEGSFSRAWFLLLQGSIENRWKFFARNRRPPRDPVNVLLSLSYTMVVSRAQHIVHSAGFDCYLGFLHSARSGRPSLALDVVESLRPAADLFVLGLLDRIVHPADFSIDGSSGCVMSKDARHRYFACWAGSLGHWPDWRDVLNEPISVAKAHEIDNSTSLIAALQSSIEFLAADIRGCESGCQGQRTDTSNESTRTGGITG